MERHFVNQTCSIFDVMQNTHSYLHIAKWTIFIEHLRQNLCLCSGVLSSLLSVHKTPVYTQNLHRVLCYQPFLCSGVLCYWPFCAQEFCLHFCLCASPQGDHCPSEYPIQVGQFETNLPGLSILKTKMQICLLSDVLFDDSWQWWWWWWIVLVIKNLMPRIITLINEPPRLQTGFLFLYYWISTSAARITK